MDIAAAVEAFCVRNPRAKIVAREDVVGVTLGLSGYLELQVSHELQHLLTQTIKDMESGKRLAVDLSAVCYISSTGVGALTTALIEARKRNINIVFLRAPKEVMSILKVLGLASFFPLEDADG